MAKRVISRITDSVKPEVRWLINRGRRFRISAGRTEVFSAEGVIERAYHWMRFSRFSFMEGTGKLEGSCDGS
jgi:hypothetical protein